MPVNEMLISQMGIDLAILKCINSIGSEVVKLAHASQVQNLDIVWVASCKNKAKLKKISAMLLMNTMNGVEFIAWMSSCISC